MKINFLKIQNRKAAKTISDYKQDVLLKQGREQLKKLQEKGISIPVFFL